LNPRFHRRAFFCFPPVAVWEPFPFPVSMAPDETFFHDPIVFFFDDQVVLNGFPLGDAMRLTSVPVFQCAL